MIQYEMPMEVILKLLWLCSLIGFFAGFGAAMGKSLFQMIFRSKD